MDGEDVQAVVEVFAEALLLDEASEVAVRRGDQADVDLARPGAADTLELLLLEDPEELWLEFQRDLPHLIEEERAAMGHLEASDLLRDGPGEGTPLVTEELTLEEPRGDGRAVDLDEGSLAAAASVVDGARDQFLPRAGLAEDERGRVGRRDGLHVPKGVAERTALADDFLERMLGADLALEVEALLGELFRELGDLPECERVGDRHRDLAGDFLDHLDRRRRERLGLDGAHGQRAEPAIADDERDSADGPDARLAHRCRRVGEATRVSAEEEGLSRGERVAGGRAREPLADIPAPIARLGGDRVDHELAGTLVVEREGVSGRLQKLTMPCPRSSAMARGQRVSAAVSGTMSGCCVSITHPE